MRGRPARLFVADMLRAIDKMGRYTEGMDATSFAADEFTVDAVLRNLMVLGEAARNVPPVRPALEGLLKELEGAEPTL